jgi:hypothetical protein
MSSRSLSGVSIALTRPQLILNLSDLPQRLFEQGGCASQERHDIHIGFEARFVEARLPNIVAGHGDDPINLIKSQVSAFKIVSDALSVAMIVVVQVGCSCGG